MSILLIFSTIRAGGGSKWSIVLNFFDFSNKGGWGKGVEVWVMAEVKIHGASVRSNTSTVRVEAM